MAESVVSAVPTNPFADCVKNILSSSKKRSKFILSKALKDKDVEERIEKKRRKVQNDIELVDEEGTVHKNEEFAVEEETPKAVEAKAEKKAIRSDVVARIKPVFDEKERNLNAVATRGVVRLFNTLRHQQKTIEENLEKAGPSERKKDKVLSKFTKSKFLDKLKEVDVKTNTKTEDKKQGWKVLKDDFRMDAKLKDWDNDNESSSSEDIA